MAGYKQPRKVSKEEKAAKRIKSGREIGKHTSVVLCPACKHSRTDLWAEPCSTCRDGSNFDRLDILK